MTAGDSCYPGCFAAPPRPRCGRASWRFVEVIKGRRLMLRGAPRRLMQDRLGSHRSRIGSIWTFCIPAVRQLPGDPESCTEALQVCWPCLHLKRAAQGFLDFESAVAESKERGLSFAHGTSGAWSAGLALFVTPAFETSGTSGTACFPCLSQSARAFSRSLSLSLSLSLVHLRPNSCIIVHL